MQPLAGYYQGEFHYTQPTKNSIDATGYFQEEFHYTQPTKIFNRYNHRLDTTRGNFTTHNQPKYSIDATIDWILPGEILLHTTNQNKYSIDATIQYTGY
jgi:hypothetical protein